MIACHESSHSKVPQLGYHALVVVLPRVHNFLLLFIIKFHDLEDDLQQILLHRSISRLKVRRQNILEIVSVQAVR